jgi:hypothetical protein
MDTTDRKSVEKSGKSVSSPFEILSSREPERSCGSLLSVSGTIRRVWYEKCILSVDEKRPEGLTFFKRIY